MTLLADTPLSGRPNARAAARRKVRLVLAAIASCLLHVGVAAVFLQSKKSAPSSAPPPMGEIELMMVEQKGRSDAKPTPTAPAQPETTSGNPSGTAQSANQPEPPKPTIPPTQPPSPDAEAVPSVAAAPQGDKSSQPPASQKAPVFDLAGTDSDTNAQAMGDRILPASPDSRYRNRAPIYPDSAALIGQQGTVTLLIHVTADGRTARAEVLETSGVAALDDAALNAVRDWHFRPAIEEGKAVPFDMPFRFVFSVK